MGFAGWLTSILNLLGMGGGGSAPVTPGGKVCGTVGMAPRVAGTVGMALRTTGTPDVAVRMAGTVAIEEC